MKSNITRRKVLNTTAVSGALLVGASTGVTANQSSDTEQTDHNIDIKFVNNSSEMRKIRINITENGESRQKFKGKIEIPGIGNPNLSDTSRSHASISDLTAPDLSHQSRIDSTLDEGAMGSYEAEFGLSTGKTDKTEVKIEDGNTSDTQEVIVWINERDGEVILKVYPAKHDKEL